jgi:hypothetical protein
MLFLCKLPSTSYNRRNTHSFFKKVASLRCLDTKRYPHSHITSHDSHHATPHSARVGKRPPPGPIRFAACSVRAPLGTYNRLCSDVRLGSDKASAAAPSGPMLLPLSLHAHIVFHTYTEHVGGSLALLRPHCPGPPRSHHSSLKRTTDCVAM